MEYSPAVENEEAVWTYMVKSSRREKNQEQNVLSFAKARKDKKIADKFYKDT